MPKPKPPARSRPVATGERAASPHRIRAIGSWTALGGLFLLYAIRPELRDGLAVYPLLGYLLLVWFFLARTKTLSWQSVVTLFSLCLPLALAVGLVTYRLAPNTTDPGASVALAALAEESLALVPALLLVALAPNRVKRFSATDWLLVGFVTGLSFQTVDDLARRTYGHLLGAPARALSDSYPQYGLSPISGGMSRAGLAAFPGRHVLTALTTVTIGLAVAAWRHSNHQPRLSPLARNGWRAIAVLGPLGAWWLTVSVHAGYNATMVLGDRWASTDNPSVPWLLRIGWQIGNQGFWLGWLLLLLLVIALLVDAGRLRNAAEEAEDPLPYPFAPTRTADLWAGRLTRWAGTRTALPIAAAVWLIAAGCAVVAYAVRDLVVVLVAHGIDPRPLAPEAVPTNPSGLPLGKGRPAIETQPISLPSTGARTGQRIGAGSSAGSAGPATGPIGPTTGRIRVRTPRRESRWAAVARGRAAGVMVRVIRADAMGLAVGPATAFTRRMMRLVGLVGLAGAVLAALWLGPHWAQQIGVGAGSSGGAQAAAPPIGRTPAWLAGVLHGLDPWWMALAGWQWAALGLGLVALMVFSASPLDVPFGPLKSSAFLLDRSAGARAGRDPILDLQSYLAASTPTEVVVDGLGTALSLVPGSAGPGTSRDVRGAVRQFLEDPVLFIGGRRAAAEAARKAAQAGHAVPVRVRTHTDLPAIKLADGRLLSPLSDDDERLFISLLDDLVRGDIRTRNENAEYQVRIYGDDERLISRWPEKWSDGQNTAYGMVGDTAFYNGRGSSWYSPQTLPESIRHKAFLEMDRRLIEYSTVVYYPASPFRALEITTNHPLVAQALEVRMARLAIPGYVVLEP
jgi:hypothetical protein